MDIQEITTAIRPVLEQADIVHAAIFGSLARGDAGKDSDIDLLVEFRGEKTLLDIVALKQELEHILGRNVDVLTRRAVSPLLRDQIEAEALPIL